MSGTGPVHVARAAAVEVPAGTAWLTETESRVYDGLRFERRAADWRLGRWVAKRALAAALGLDPDRPRDIEVLASPGGAPTARVLRGNVGQPVSVSLSHSGGFGFAAAAVGTVGLGCDVEAVEARSEAFVADYFTANERAWIEDGSNTRDLRANLLWSAKESALKALGEGLRMDTRSVEAEVEPVPGAGESTEWNVLSVAVPDGRVFPGFWRALDGRVWTLAAEAPIRLA